MSLLKQNVIKKEQINKLLEIESEFNIEKNKEYKVKAICNSKVYTKKTVGQLLGLYCLVSWKDYTDEKSIWESALAVMYLHKIINAFYKNHSEKSTIMLLPINSTSLMVKLIAKLTAKTLNAIERKCG